MYVFRPNQLALENKLVCSFLGKTISPVTSFLQLLTVLRLGRRSHRHCSSQSFVFIDTLLVQLIFWQLCCSNFLVIASGITMIKISLQTP